MKKIFIINGGQLFAHSGGRFNATLSDWTADFFRKEGFEVQITNINESYVLEDEVRKFVWADIVIYHTPVWWFQVPFKLKEYVDLVFTAGHQNGIYNSDGRSRRSDNPKLHYGTGGLLQGRKYMLTTTWNAPIEAFTVEGEFFDLKNEDEILIGVHKMNKFIGMTPIQGFHFHEMEKDVTDAKIEQEHLAYLEHLKKILPQL